MNAYIITIGKDPDVEGTNISLKWVYGEPHQNLLMEQVFKGDSIKFEQLQKIVSDLDEAVEWKKKELKE